jgi:hypothetical protein
VKSRIREIMGISGIVEIMAMRTIPGHCAQGETAGTRTLQGSGLNRYTDRVRSFRLFPACDF